MSQFELNIRYPHHIHHNEIEHVGMLDMSTVLARFDQISWRQQLVRQLQLNGADTRFMVTDHASGQSIAITLDAYAKSQQLEFKLDSDVVVIVPKKDVFGLVTRKSKETISFKQLSLARAKDYLTAFLNRDIALLEQKYKDNLSKGI